MNFITGRDGSISVIRVGVIAAIVGVLAIIGGVVFFFVDRATHQVPLSIDLYPGAVIWYQKDRSDISRSVFYKIPGAKAEDVADFYQKKLNDFYGNSEEKCVRDPAAGNYPDYDAGKPNIGPYLFSCMFDHSGFEITQYTRVNIQPGIPSAQTEGSVVVEYDQNWQR